MSRIHPSRVRSVVLSLSLLVIAGGGVLAGNAAPRVRPGVDGAVADQSGVGSVGLVLGEVVTGGSTGSDEFVEIHNGGRTPLDLRGSELVYVTATGSTVTRKATWTSSLVIDPGRHLLLANSLGRHASAADVIYSGGLSSTGGTLVLRPVNGQPTDALGWGDATNAYVEKRPAPAPPADSSVERLPGGAEGNWYDTNDNLLDTRIEGAPVPQNLAAPATPAADATPDPGSTEAPPPSASILATPDATAPSEPDASISAGPWPSSSDLGSPTATVDERPLPTATVEAPAPTPADPTEPVATYTLDTTPTALPTSTADPAATSAGDATPIVTAVPTAAATPTASATSIPTGLSSPPPTASAAAPTATGGSGATPTTAPTASHPATSTPGTPDPTPADVIPIASARVLPPGTPVAISGVLTTAPGLFDAGTGAFVQDASGGIALQLRSAEWPLLLQGSGVRATGTVHDRYGQTTIRLADAADITPAPDVAAVSPVWSETGAAAEPLEGVLITVRGTVVGGPNQLADGFSVDVDDGSGALRVVATAVTGLRREELRRGLELELMGVLGQRDSTGSGTSGYRLYLRSGDDVVRIEPVPTPTATPRPTPARSVPPTATPRPTPRPTASPTASPTARRVMPIREARQMPVGSDVTVRGVVTVETGRLLGEQTFVVQDASAGICVRIDADGAPAVWPRGDVVEVHGRLADPYGNLEIRVRDAADMSVRGSTPPPAAKRVTSAALAEDVEGRLVRLVGVVTSIETGSGGSISVSVEDAAGEAKVFVHGALAYDRARLERGQSLAATGIAGQRASARGEPDGYRIWPRDAGDLIVLRDTPSPRPTTTPRGDAGASPRPGLGTPGTSRGGSSGGGRVVPIARAARTSGSDVTVIGVVTAPLGLLDPDSRRVTIEDASGAILVRLPEGTRVAVGERLRVTGEVDTYYGAPQLATDERPRVVGRTTRAPRALRRTPIPAALEWALVRASGRIESVRKYGTSWRAELATAAGTIPVSGGERSGIEADDLGEGRQATIVGIVRRPYPTATDQRLALIPRGPGDIVLRGGGSPAGGDAAAGDDPAGGDTAGDRGTAGGATAAGGGSGSTAAASRGTARASGAATTIVDGQPIDVDLADLRKHLGRLVRVGGLIVRIDRLALTVDDSTARAVIRLPRGSDPVARLLERGEPINAAGRVEPRGRAFEVVVEDAATIARVGDIGELIPVAASPSVGPAAAGPGTQPFGAAPDIPPTSSPADGRQPPPAAILAFVALAAAASAMAAASRPGRQLTRSWLLRSPLGMRLLSSPLGARLLGAARDAEGAAGRDPGTEAGAAAPDPGTDAEGADEPLPARPRA